MKQNPTPLIVATLHAEAEATQAHQRLAAACQRTQDAIAAAMRCTLGHRRRWQINSRTWQLHTLDLWVSSNIEFSRPALAFTVTLRPEDDEPLLRIRLQALVPLADIHVARPLPTDIDLPTTLPMTHPVDIFPHYRAHSWKTYPETTIR